MKKFAVSLALGALVATASPALAGTVDVSSFTGQGANLTSTFFNGGTTAGSVTISDIQGLAPIANGSSLIGFCVDLQHTISPPLNNQNATLSMMSSWDGYGAFVPQDNAGRYAAYLYNTFAGTVSTNDQRAGLALAIWNVLYDIDFTVTAPPAAGFSATSTAGAITAANSYLSNLSLNTAVAANHDAYWVRLFPVNGVPGDAPQDFMVGVPDGGATLALLGGALLALGAARRRFAL